MIEQIPESAIHVTHPQCGAVVFVTHLEAIEDQLLIEGICYRCDRYVSLRHRTRLTALASVELKGVPHLGRTGRNDAQVRALTARALHDAHWNQRRAATALGINRKTIANWIKRFDLHP